MKTPLSSIPFYLQLLVLSLLLPQIASCQRNKSVQEGTYKSLDEAKQNTEKVKVLNLKGQKLKQVPTEVFNFPNLTQLYLSNNQITALPEEIGKLSYLTVLDVSKNKLTALPSSIGNMQQLASIDFSQNKITTLPMSFFQLPSIEIIKMFSNPLSFDISKLAPFQSKLKYINIYNTKLSVDDCDRLNVMFPKAKVKCAKGCACNK
jgi:Leucine-rich repeat (LRR) protein